MDTSNPAHAAVTVVLTPDPGGKPVHAAGFVHPGVLVSQEQLEHIQKRVAARTEPQQMAFEALKAGKLAALDYSPTPRDTVERGSYSRPDLGCKDEQPASEAACAQALLWFITDNNTYAANAIRIMNAWSATPAGGHTNNNDPVQASWTGDVWPRAAEIMRYSNPGWSDTEIARFQNMLRTQYPPSLVNGACENGTKS